MRSLVLVNYAGLVVYIPLQSKWTRREFHSPIEFCAWISQTGVCLDELTAIYISGCQSYKCDVLAFKFRSSIPALLMFIFGIGRIYSNCV